MNTSSGYSLLLNSATMKYYGMNAEFANHYGTDFVIVDYKGNPTGYLCEAPAVKIATMIPISVEESKEFILSWQKFAFENGFTGASDAGVEIVTPSAFLAYEKLVMAICFAPQKFHFVGSFWESQ